jgi:hypothetical protein
MLVGGVLLVVSGCGGSSQGAVERAADRTAAAPGYKVSFSSTIRVSGGRPLPYSGSGSVDNGSRRTRVLVKGALAGEEIVDGARGTTVYLRFPAAAAQLASRKPWLRFEVTKRLWRSHFNLGAVALTQGNPAQYVEALRALRGGARKLGDGRYGTTIPVAGRARPVSVWIADGYVSRLRLSYSVPVPASKRTIVYDTTIRYSGFGPQPAISLPAEGEVARIGADGKLEQ